MKLIAIALLAVTLSAQTFDGNGALEAFYQQPKHHWYASKRFWVPVAAVAAGFAIGVAANSMRSGVSTYRPSPAMQPSAPVPQQPGILDVTHIGIGGPGTPVVIVHGGLN